MAVCDFLPVIHDYTLNTVHIPVALRYLSSPSNHRVPLDINVTYLYNPAFVAGANGHTQLIPGVPLENLPEVPAHEQARGPAFELKWVQIRGGMYARHNHYYRSCT